MALFVDQSAEHGTFVSHAHARASRNDARPSTHELRLFVCVLLSAGLVLLAASDATPMLWRLRAWADMPWLPFMVASAALAIGGLGTWKRASAALPRFDENTLLALFIALPFAFSCATLVAPQLFPDVMRDGRGRLPTFFAATAVTVTSVVLVEVLELRVKWRTAQLLERLSSFTPPFAMRLDALGNEERVAAVALAVGDQIRVLPGERFAVDGEILDGNSTVDEAMLSGQSRRVARSVGDRVVGGTLNVEATLVVRAKHVGKHLVIARVSSMVAAAQRQVAAVERSSARTVRRFLLVCLAVAVATYVGQLFFGAGARELGAFQHGISILVLACPCAALVAARLAMSVGTAAAARRGILIKHAPALETVARADVVLVDKTGTLTTGHPQLMGVEVFVPDYDDVKLLRLVAGLEAGSSHPVGIAIREGVEALELEALPVTTFGSLDGRGVYGRFEGRTVGVGSLALLVERGVDITPLEARERHFEAAGQSVVWAFEETRCIGSIVLADQLGAGVREAVDKLTQRGLEVEMVTGDSQETAAVIARQLGISDYRANLRPDDKAQHIEEWQQEGWTVAMVGDGDNDAPALARADVGVAMGSGSDQAIDAADIALVGAGFDSIVTARDLGRAALRNARQNLFLALGVVALGLPFVAGLAPQIVPLSLLSIMAAGLAALAAVLVGLNAWRFWRGSNVRVV